MIHKILPQGSPAQVQLTCSVFCFFFLRGWGVRRATPYLPSELLRGDCESHILDSQLLSQRVESVHFCFYVPFPHLDFKLLRQGLL